MALKIIGKKRGMTQLFDDKGNLVPCTVIEIEPNVVAQIKTKENDGYTALQLAADKINVKDARTVAKRLAKPQIGHYAKQGIAPRRILSETRLDKVEEYAIGQEIGVEAFKEIEFVDVAAMSKGKGYQGVMKLHGFAGGPASHGSGFHRHAGSTGMRSTPGRCLKGGPRASHMGHERVTVQNIQVVKIDSERHLLILKGQVPGHRNCVVSISPAVKKKVERKKKVAA